MGEQGGGRWGYVMGGGVVGGKGGRGRKGRGGSFQKASEEGSSRDQKQHLFLRRARGGPHAATPAV